MLFSPDMQPVLRDMRSLFRQPLVSRVLHAEWFQRRDLFRRLVIYVARCYTGLERRPRFVLARVKRAVRLALRSVERGRVPAGLFLTFEDDMLQLLCMMNGEFCGRGGPDACCCICLGEGGRRGWWRSANCGHCFHARCIAAHLLRDQRCPLCRGLCC